MVILKSVVLIALAATFVNCKDVNLRTRQQVYIPKPLTLPKEHKATVVSSNLPEEDQQDLVAKLQEIYDTHSNFLSRAIQFSNYVDSKYTRTLNNIAWAYEAAAYSQKFYTVLTVSDEYVLVYGI